MPETPPGPETLRTTAGDFPLDDYRLRLAGREWSVLHTTAVLTYQDEAHYFRELVEKLPYGVALWASSVGLAHDLAGRGDQLRGRSVLELGAGTGLPGIVAATLGARVVQTDYQEVSLSVCRRNGARNGADGIEYRLADWTTWDDDSRYDLLIGSDVLYGEKLQPHLRRILDTAIAPGGRALIADPLRIASLRLLEEMEGDGWGVSFSRWSIGEGRDARWVGIFELTPPA